MTDNDFETGFKSPEPSKRKRRLPRTPVSLFDNDDELNNSDDLAPLTGEDDGEYETINFDSKRKTAGKRDNKTWRNTKSLAPDSYDFTAIPKRDSTLSPKALSRFKQGLADILINGNMRIKFSPKLATREGAKLYCQSKLDDRGYPRFKLIGTNTTDPFGNDICDMNGDKVDDIIICDKQGNPVIINGYKLVQASPYKKAWMNMRYSGKTKDSFETWLATEFSTVKDWSKINGDDWQRGKLEWDLSSASANAQAAYNEYNNLGLGKPRLNTRLSPRALWSSLYSEFIWSGAKASFEAGNTTIASLIKLVNYLKLANAMYVLYIEWEAAKTSDKTDWIQWVNYKQMNPKLTNQILGVKVQQTYRTLKQEETTYANNNETAGPTTDLLMKLTIRIIKQAFNVNANGEKLVQICTLIDSGEATTSQLKQYREYFKKNLDRVIGTIPFGEYGPVKGYLSYVKQQEEHKPKKVENFDSYMNMNWKNLNQANE